MKRYIDKETGEKKAFGNLQVYAEAENTNERQFLGNFDSFKQILEYYEDYTPKEPLIKDPKARKLFRKWADLFGAEQFRVNHFSDSRRKTTSIGSADIVTEPVIELPGHIGEDSEIYTKEELCGEEG